MAHPKSAGSSTGGLASAADLSGSSHQALVNEPLLQALANPIYGYRQNVVICIHRRELLNRT